MLFCFPSELNSDFQLGHADARGWRDERQSLSSYMIDGEYQARSTAMILYHFIMEHVKNH